MVYCAFLTLESLVLEWIHLLEVGGLILCEDYILFNTLIFILSVLIFRVYWPLVKSDLISDINLK